MKRFAPGLAALALCTAPAAAAAPDLRPALEALSAKGNGEAAYHLGMIHHLGLNGTPKDARKAFELFQLAAERGDPLGAYKLGCYYDGQGEGIVESDPDLALRYKLVAAEAGYALAQHDVARLYIARKEISETLRWLEAAARQGHAESLAALSAAYMGQVPSTPIEPDAVKGYGYMLLFIRTLPSEASLPAETDLRRQYPGGISDEDADAALAMVSGWTFAPTPLTLKARNGQQAAQRLTTGA